MAERKRNKQKRRNITDEKPTKEETKVAKYMRWDCPIREAGKVVDKLMESKFATGADALFTTRSGCIDFCNRLLIKNMFHRAHKIEKKKKKEIESKKEEKDSEKKSKNKNKKGEISEKEDTKKDEEKEKDKKKDGKTKKVKKLKLEMHDDQIFKDGDEVYVWIYDPTSVKTFVIGFLLVFGAIGVCMFPLWPPEVRQGVYYLSLAAAGFVGLIISLCIIRAILFGCVWAGTFGKHHFWLLPNLTEDVGFFESFVPLYHHETSDDKGKKKKDKGKSKEEKAEEKEEEKGESGVKDEEEADSEKSGSDVSDAERTDNGYELVDHADADDEPKKEK